MDASCCKVLGSGRNSLVGNMPAYDNPKPNPQRNILGPRSLFVCVCLLDQRSCFRRGRSATNGLYLTAHGPRSSQGFGFSFLLR